jgi:transposase
LDPRGERVDLWVEHAAETRWACPACQQPLPCRDHAEERVWRHLHTCQYQTLLHARVPRRDVGVDEKAFRKGHRYHTILCDLEQATVDFVAEDRTAASLQAYDTQLTEAQRAELHAVAMDMWPAYIRATRDGLPAGDANIVFDRFHVMREMTRAVDTVREQEHRALVRVGDPVPLAPVTRVARTTKRHADGVLRYVRHRITNGVAEGLNSTIMSIKRMAGGFRNAEHFTTAIYLHCGGLDLYPR